MREIFADQFEENADGFLYRKGMKGPPIKVSDSERASFVAAYNRSLRRGSWGLGLSLLLLTIPAIFWMMQTEGDLPDLWIYLGLGLVVTLFVVMNMWAYYAPSRALARRPVLGSPRSRAEMRRHTLARLSYGQIAAMAAVIALLLFNRFESQDITSGWNLLWLAGGALVLILLAYRAFEKWRGAPLETHETRY